MIELRAFTSADVEPLRQMYNALVAPAMGWTEAEAPGLWSQVALGGRTRVAVRDGRVVGAVSSVLAPPWQYIWPLVVDDDEAAALLVEDALSRRTPDVRTARVGVRAGEEPKRRALVARGFAPSIQFHELVHDLVKSPDNRRQATGDRRQAMPGRCSGAWTLGQGEEIDREAARELHNVTFSEIDNTAPLGADDFAQMLDGPTAWPEGTAVWSSAGESAGFVIGLRGRDALGTFGILEAIGVAPSARGRGLARVMTDWLLDRARSAGFAEVRSVVAGTNAASLALHAAAGFALREHKQMYDLTGL